MLYGGAEINVVLHCTTMYYIFQYVISTNVIKYFGTPVPSLVLYSPERMEEQQREAPKLLFKTKEKEPEPSFIQRQEYRRE